MSFIKVLHCVYMCDDVPGPHTHKIDLIWFLVCKLSSLIFVQIKFYGQTTFERYYVVTVIAGLWVSILFFLCAIVCDYYAICTYTKLEYLHFLEECVET